MQTTQSAAIAQAWVHALLKKQTEPGLPYWNFSARVTLASFTQQIKNEIESMSILTPILQKFSAELRAKNLGSGLAWFAVFVDAPDNKHFHLTMKVYGANDPLRMFPDLYAKIFVCAVAADSRFRKDHWIDVNRTPEEMELRIRYMLEFQGRHPQTHLKGKIR
jgi:hypothetical protein